MLRWTTVQFDALCVGSSSRFPLTMSEATADLAASLEPIAAADWLIGARRAVVKSSDWPRIRA